MATQGNTILGWGNTILLYGNTGQHHTWLGQHNTSILWQHGATPYLARATQATQYFYIATPYTSCIAVKIKASKTDPFRQGVTVYLGATGTNLCLVKAILAYIA